MCVTVRKVIVSGQGIVNDVIRSRLSWNVRMSRVRVEGIVEIDWTALGIREEVR